MNGKKGKHASGVAVWFQTFLKKKRAEQRILPGTPTTRGVKVKKYDVHYREKSRRKSCRLV